MNKQFQHLEFRNFISDIKDLSNIPLFEIKSIPFSNVAHGLGRLYFLSI